MSVRGRLTRVNTPRELSINRRVAALGLTLVLAVGLVARLQPMLSHPETRRGGFGSFGDTWLYHTIALNLVEGKGFSAASPRVSSPGRMAPPVSEPVIRRGPVYPFFVSLVYRFLVSADDFKRQSISPQNLNQISRA